MMRVSFCKKIFAEYQKAFCLGVFSLFLLLPTITFSQVSGGTISGRVLDAAEAVVPGAQVTIKNIGTGLTTQLVTNNEGIYRASNLLPGDYEITANATNFSPFLQKGIVLTVGADLTIDLKLTPGGVEASVTISSTPTVDTTTPTLSAVVSERTIVELPLNGRDWTSLATLQPGISSVRPQAPSGATAARGNRGYGDELSISGHRPQENNYRVDGVSINDYSNGAPGSAGGVNLGADAIKEFSVLASNYTAEYGRTSGGVINAITRSGTNSFHGSAYEFFRNDALDARNFFDGQKPPLRRNQFGVSGGGPIIKNKTFIFGDYEGIRRNLGVTSIANVLSANARQGILSTGNVTVNAAIVPYLAFWQLPNGPLNAGGDTGPYRTVLKQVFNEDFFTFRVDHQLSAKDSIFGTYFYDSGSFSVPDALNNATFPNKTNRQMVAIEETHTFNQDFVNSIRFGFNRTKGDVNIEGEAINPIAANVSLGSITGRPAAILQVPGLTSAVANGGNSFFAHLQNSYQFYDDAFLTRGNHSFRFGFAYEKIEYNELGLRRQNGLFAFGSIAAFLTNAPTSFFALDPTRRQETGVRSSIWAGYFNDSWRVSQKLNLNLGLRYEMSTIPRERNNLFTAVRNLSGGAIQNVESFFTSNPTLANFEPRVGFAYDVFGDAKTAFRGGFGIYDALPLPWIFTPKVAQGTPFNVGTTVRNLAVGDFPTIAFTKINFATVPGDSLFIETDPKRSYVMNWNLTVQHQIVKDLTVTAAYVGSRGVHTARVTDDANIVLPTNAADEYPTWTGTTVVNPNAGSLRSNFWDGNNHYHGMQLQLLKSLSRGVQAQASYTWSKCIDEGSGASRNDQFSNGITTPIYFNKSNNRGRCDYDLSHVFVSNALWLLPGPKTGVAGAILGNWQLGGIVNVSSGIPFSIFISGDPLGLRGLDVVGFPNVVAGCNLTNPNNYLQYVNAACFTVPNPIRKLGNVGRNLVTGPGLFNLDMALYKNIALKAISEDFRIQLRLEAFNVLNHTNFAAPLSNNAVFNQTGGAISSFGRITSTQTTSRQIQLGLRFNW